MVFTCDFTLMSVKGSVTLCGDQVWNLILGAIFLFINPYCRIEAFGLFHSWSKHHSVLCWLLPQRPIFHIYLLKFTLFLLKALTSCIVHRSDRPMSIPRAWVWHFLVWWFPAGKINSCKLMILKINMFAFTVYSLKTGQFCTNDTERCLNSCDLLLKQNIP